MDNPKYTHINPATKLSTGGMLDVLSLARIHEVKISVGWFEEGECYILTVSKGERISENELDNARNDELAFRHKLHYAIHRIKFE